MSEITRIIIIDDDVTFSDSLALYLKNNGYYAEGVSSGKEALEKLDKEEFDIALCDYNLPDVKGLDLAKEIMEKHPDITTVIITGVRVMDLAMDAMRRGVYDYIVKPVDYNELDKVLNEIISEKKKEEKKSVKEDEGPLQGKREKVKEEKEQSRAQKKKIPDKTVPPVPPEGGEKAPSEEYKFTELRDKDKTVFDLFVDKTKEIKRNIITWGVYFISLLLVFFLSDTLFLQLTGPGRLVHNKFWPPSLIIDSVPTAVNVSIKTKEGKNILKEGVRTPVQVDKISPGAYQLIMNHEGYKTTDKKITVSDTGQDSQNIIIPGSRRDYAEGKTRSFIVPLEINLEIDSNPPGAEVFMNDKRLGIKTPVSLDIPVDRYNIVLETEGYKPLGARSIGETVGRCLLDLRPDSDNEIDTRFWEVSKTRQGLSLYGSFWDEVSVNSDPQGATVYIGEEVVGKTPLGIRVSVGEHKIKIHKEGFRDWSQEITIPGQMEINAVLKKAVTFKAKDKNSLSRSLAAEVLIDGKKIAGKAPLEHTLSVGRHQVTFSAPPEYKNWTRNIVIREQNTITAHMERTLHPVTVHVLSESDDTPIKGATVFVDGEKAGKTSNEGKRVVNIRLQPHKLKVSAPGYAEKSLDYEKPVSGDTIKIFISKEDETGPGEEKVSPKPQETQEKESAVSDESSMLIIDTRPNFPGAEIYLNGNKIGETVRRVSELPGGKHVIEIEHPFTGRVKSSVYVEPGERIIVNFNSVGEAILK